MMPTTISQALDAHGRGAKGIELQSVNQQISDFTFNKQVFTAVGVII
jgi:hypothetical protein